MTTTGIIFEEIMMIFPYYLNRRSDSFDPSETISWENERHLLYSL